MLCLNGALDQKLALSYLAYHFLSSASFLQASYDPKSLSTFFHDHANTTESHPRTGKIYNLSLPGNFSGMESSFLRFRSKQLWHKGLNFSSVYIPPMCVLTMPYVKRVAIVYDNLGNWSSLYFQASNYRLIAPVIGFQAYDVNYSSIAGSQKIDFLTPVDSIVIKFPRADVQLEEIPMCVEFGTNGSYLIKNMTGGNECRTDVQGHFSIIVPSRVAPTPWRARKNREKWLTGLIGAICGLVLLWLVMLVVYKLLKMKQLEDTEKQSEKDVAFSTLLVGRSTLPSATMTKTLPHSLEPEL